MSRNGYNDGGISTSGRRRDSNNAFDSDIKGQHRIDDYGGQQFDLSIPDKYWVDRQTSTTDFHLFAKALKDGEMSNQVLGSRYENYNQNRPEALDGYNQLRKTFPDLLMSESNREYHNWPIGAHPLEVAAERRPHRQQQQYESPRYEPTSVGAERRSHHKNYYESPRYEPKAHYSSVKSVSGLKSYERPQPQPQPRPQYNDHSPRHEYESRTYRTGRPDIGVEMESNVPYPQEPLRRAKHDYEQPPDIGFDPYKEPAGDKPPNHPGWLLLLRFNKSGDDQVRKALTFASQIAKDGGRVLGIARPPHGICLQEGGEGWETNGRVLMMPSGVREAQLAPIREHSTNCVLAIFYPSLRKAQEWFDRDYFFKQKDFPHPYTIDCVALPLSSAIDYRHCRTLVMTEYPTITHAYVFRDSFSIPTEMLMRSKYRASPYIVKAFNTPTTDPVRRVIRHFRGYWISRNSIVTVSAFGSMREAQGYFNDADYRKAKAIQDRVSTPTTVIFDLESAGHY